MPGQTPSFSSQSALPLTVECAGVDVPNRVAHDIRLYMERTQQLTVGDCRCGC